MGYDSEPRIWHKVNCYIDLAKTSHCHEECLHAVITKKQRQGKAVAFEGFVSWNSAESTGLLDQVSLSFRLTGTAFFFL